LNDAFQNVRWYGGDHFGFYVTWRHGVDGDPVDALPKRARSEDRGWRPDRRETVMRVPPATASSALSSVGRFDLGHIGAARRTL